MEGDIVDGWFGMVEDLFDSPGDSFSVCFVHDAKRNRQAVRVRAIVRTAHPNGGITLS